MVTVDSGGDQGRVSREQIAATLEIPARGDAVRMHREHRARRAAVFELLVSSFVDAERAVVRHEALRPAVADERACDVADTCVRHLVADEAGASARAAARARHRRIRARQDFIRREERVGGERGDAGLCGLGGESAVTQAVDDEHRNTFGILQDAPAVAALDLAFERDVDRAVTHAAAAPEARHHERALAGDRMNVEVRREPAHGAESRARRAARREAVRHAARDVAHARAAVDREQLDDRGFRGTQRLQQNFAVARVAMHVRRQFRGRDRDLAGRLRVELVVSQRLRRASRLADLARVIDHEALLRRAGRNFHGHFHRSTISIA
jgi:hypothetical protein